MLLLFTSVELELTFFSIDTRQSVCRRLPKHDCLSAVTSCPSGMYVCLWREQTTDGRCLFGAFVTSNTVYWSNLRKIPKALELSKKKNITTTRTGSTAECASCMHRQTITRGEKKIEPQHLDKLFIIRHLVLLRHNHCYEQVHSCSAVRCCTRSTSRQPSNSNSMRPKMRQFLPALRHRPLLKNAPCECTLNKFGLHFRHCHQRTKHCQCLQRKTSWRTVAVPRKANATAATANLSSTRVRPPVTTSPDNHHAQAPRHPAPKSEALCEILDLLDGPLSFFLTFFSWLIILVQLPKVAVRYRSSNINFEAHSAQAQCSKTICHC